MKCHQLDMEYAYLIAPLVYDRHVDVIHENSHPFARWGAICCTHSFIDIALDSSLLKIKQTSLNSEPIETTTHENITDIP